MEDRTVEPPPETSEVSSGVRLPGYVIGSDQATHTEDEQWDDRPQRSDSSRWCLLDGGGYSSSNRAKVLVWVTQVEEPVYQFGCVRDHRCQRFTQERRHVERSKYDPAGGQRDESLQFTVTVMGYYDIVDDFIDGDVTEGAEADVYLTNELLQPVVIRLLNRLGDDAVRYWSKHATRMLCCFVEQLQEEPDTETYLHILDLQSELYGTITGISAILADESSQTIELAAMASKHYFKYDQVLLGREQYETDGPDPWNAWRLMPESEAIDHLQSWQHEIHDYLSTLPDERATLIRPFVALDIEEWIDDFE